jgi:hypothetical protein
MNSAPSTYSCATAKPLAAAYSLSSFSFAGIEKPSFPCSLEETRALDHRLAASGIGGGGLGVFFMPFSAT